MSNKTPAIDSKNDWFLLWNEDSCIDIETMAQSYNHEYELNCREQLRKDLKIANTKYEETLDLFKTMSDEEVNRWCYYESIKKGWI